MGAGNELVDFSIITPSYNMLDYLKLCCASVADQQGATFEHIVVDGASTDETAAWLAVNPRVDGISEKDDGMYDAIDKGLLKSHGRYWGWLNCDEQYLPGTLRTVREYFERNPSVDAVFGDTLLIRPDGSLAYYRKAYPLRWFYLMSAPDIHSCSVFMRRELLRGERNFDPSYRTAADVGFFARLLRAGCRFAHLKRYLAVFTLTGTNLGASPGGLRERDRLLLTAPAWVRTLRMPLNIVRWGEKLLAGSYHQRMPVEYEVFTSEASDARTLFRARKASKVRYWEYRRLEAEGRRRERSW